MTSSTTVFEGLISKSALNVFFTVSNASRNDFLARELFLDVLQESQMVIYFLTNHLEESLRRSLNLLDIQIIFLHGFSLDFYQILQVLKQESQGLIVMLLAVLSAGHFTLDQFSFCILFFRQIPMIAPSLF